MVAKQNAENHLLDIFTYIICTEYNSSLEVVNSAHCGTKTKFNTLVYFCLKKKLVDKQMNYSN